MAGDASAGRDASNQSLAASERDEATRAAWRDDVAQRDPEPFVVVDESGPHTSLTRLYGWAPHDQRAVGSVPRHHGQNTTLVAALTPQGLQAPGTSEGAMATTAFERSLTQGLGPTLRPGPVVLLDNLSVHKAASLREAIEAQACELLFRPPSSPDCTPIEPAFSKIKALIRGVGARTREALLEAVSRAVAAITKDDATGWFAHAGYPLPASSS